MSPPGHGWHQEAGNKRQVDAMNGIDRIRLEQPRRSTNRGRSLAAGHWSLVMWERAGTRGQERGTGDQGLLKSIGQKGNKANRQEGNKGASDEGPATRDW